VNVKPKTYNEVVRLARCLEVDKYFPGLPDQTIEEMYNYICTHPEYSITITRSMIFYKDQSGETMKEIPVENIIPENNLIGIVLGASVFKVVNRQISPSYNSDGTGYDGGGSFGGGSFGGGSFGGGSFGGGSSNNNNNNA